MKVHLWVRQRYRPQRAPGHRPALRGPSLQRVRALPPPQRQPEVGRLRRVLPKGLVQPRVPQPPQRLLQHLPRPEEVRLRNHRLEGLTEDHWVGLREGRLVAQRADQMGGHLEDPREGLMEGRKAVRLEGLMEGHWAGRMEAL